MQQRGWNPPVIVFSAIYTEVLYEICNQQLQISKQVRLSWNVTGAIWIYLIGVGRLTDAGSMEIRSAQYTLLAINGLGASIFRLPLIEVPQTVLGAQLTMNPQSGPGNIRAILDAGSVMTTDELRVQWEALATMGTDDLPDGLKLCGAAELGGRVLGQKEIPSQWEWNPANTKWR